MTIWLVDALGVMPTLDNRREFFTGLVIAAFATWPIWLVCKRARLGEIWLGLPILLGYAIIWGVLTTIESSAFNALELLFLLPAIASVYALRPRSAAPYVALGFVSIVAASLLDTSGVNRATQVVSLVFVTAAAVAIIGAMQERQRSLVKRYRALANRDPLTGLANLRAFESALLTEVSRDSGESAGLVLFMIDLDNFKLVNDRHSHAVGDSVLRSAAEAISEAVGPDDFVCRKGGDEFAVLARIGSDRDAGLLANDLVSAISAARAVACPDVDPNASVGFVAAQMREAPDSIIARANDALHDAKEIAHPERRGTRRSVDGLVTENGSFAERRVLSNTGGADGPLVESSPTCDANQRQSGHGDGFAQHLSWKIGTIGFAATPVVSVLMGLSGINPELRSPAVLVTAAVSFAVSPLLLKLAHHRSPELVVHGCLILSIVLLAVFLESAPNSRLALVDFFLLPGLLAAFYMQLRYALVYVVTALFMYDWFAVHQDYGFPLAKFASALLIVVVLGVLFESARKQIRTYQAKIAKLSETDALTGLENLRSLSSSLETLADECENTDQDLLVFAIDLDDFKSVNDRYSHTVGDAVLHAVAKALRSAVREQDIVARRGGDEFVIVMARNRGATWEPVVARVKAAVCRERTAICPDVNPNASVGAVIRIAGEALNDLVRRADETLHTTRLARDTHDRNSETGGAADSGHLRVDAQ